MKAEDLAQIVQIELGWDTDLTQQVLSQVKQLALDDQGTEIDDIVQNYMSDSPSCQAAVHEYVKTLQNNVWGPGMKPLKRADYNSNDALSPAAALKKKATQPSSKPPNPAPKPAKTVKSSKGAVAGNPEASSSNAIPTKSVTVRKGPVSRHAPKAKDPAQVALDSLTRKVFNCVSCGKVYDLRDKDAVGLALMRNGGLCTFCTTPLPPVAAAAAAAAASAAEDAERARLFAEKLVEFDRTSAKRTEVIDDQGDYFEIDSNQWLDAGECAALRSRQAMQEALEEDRRARVTVTVDLVGREARSAQQAVHSVVAGSAA